MGIIPLVIMTGVIVLGVLGTVAKILFDDWQVRRLARVFILLSLVKLKGQADK
jgi:hypothetical protein